MAPVFSVQSTRPRIKFTSPGEELWYALRDLFMQADRGAACDNLVEAVAWAEPSGALALFLTNVVVSSTHYRLLKSAEKIAYGFSLNRSDWRDDAVAEGIVGELRQYCVEALGFSYADRGSLRTISHFTYDALLVTSEAISDRDADEVLDRASQLNSGSIHCYICDSMLVSPIQQLTKSQRRKSIPLDHVWPRSLGGVSTPDNLLPICESCNGLKSDRSSWDVYGIVQDFTYATGGTNAGEMLQQALLRRAATKLAEENYLTLKAAFEHLGPRCGLSAIDLDEPRTFFNLSAHDTSKLSTLF